MPRQLISVLLATALSAVFVSPLQAQDSIRIETVPSATPNGKPATALLVNGEVVVRLAKPQRNRRPLRILSLASAQLSSSYRRGRISMHIEASPEDEREWVLFLDGQTFLHATDMEGKAWGAEPQALAITWMENIDKALGRSAPLHSANSSGAGNALLRQEGSSTGISGLPQGSRAEGQPGGGLISSSGHSVFEAPAHSAGSPGLDGPHEHVLVTGANAGLEIVREGIDNHIRNANGLSPGSRLVWHADKLRIAPGRDRQLKLDWIASTPGGESRRGSSSLVLENRNIHLPREARTFFSNRPERVSRAQLLYYATLASKSAGRLVFHHQNQSGTDMDFICRLLNQGSSPASVHVVPGLGEPDVNTFYVGYRSAENYWLNLNSGNGYVLRIPPGGQVFLANQRMNHGSTASGYMTISSLEGPELRLETLAVNHGSPVPAWPLQSNGEASNSVYGEPYISADMQYRTGDNWLYMKLGSQLPPSLTDSSVLQGCYGMTHSFNVELKNTRDYPALLFVVLRASAGEVKGQFFLDDEYLGTSLVMGGEEQLLKDIPLRPGETKLLRIRAIPLNGGFYPASIIIREQRYP